MILALMFQGTFSDFRSDSAVKWTEADRPVLIVDGSVYRIADLAGIVRGEKAYAVGVRDKELIKLGVQLDVATMYFYDLRVSDLSPLRQMPKLRHLRIEWNTKLTGLDQIGKLTALETLHLVNTPKTRDLTPLAALTELKALEFSGGMWSKNNACTLEPLGSLPGLEYLTLTNLSVDRGGLQPLGKCKALRELELSNQFETEDYAYLSVALPNTRCSCFAPWIPVKLPNEKDTMLIGKRNRFLNSKTDQERIAAAELKFKKLREQLATQLGFR